MASNVMAYNDEMKNPVVYIALPGETLPQTVEEAVALRKRLRAVVKNQPAMFALFGFRQTRKKRAPRSTDGLRAPTKEDEAQALALLDEGATIWETQEFCRDRGIAVTGNHLSQLGGARP